MFESIAGGSPYLPAAIFFGMACSVAGCRPAKPTTITPPPPTVTVAHPGTVPVQNYYEYNGYLDAVEAVEIRARVRGYLNDVLFKEGDEVKVGDKLYAIDPREYAAAVAKADADILKAVADIANAKAQVQLGQAEEARTREAYTKGIAAKTDLDRAVATLAANRAAVDVGAANKASAEAGRQTAELQLGYTDIRAPITGQISRTLVTRGNLVGQNESTLLTTIVTIDPLFIYFDVPERDLVEYQRALRDAPLAVQPAVFSVEVGVATEAGYPHIGQIDFRENRVDTGTGTVRIRGRVPNPRVGPGSARILYPGLFAKVRVPAGPQQPRLVLPEDALMTGQEGRFVYVIGPDNKVVKRTVTVGPQVWRAPPPGVAAPHTGWVLTDPKPRPLEGPDGKGQPSGPAVSLVRSVVAIEGGLAPNDLVVVAGLQKARPGAPVAPEEWVLGPAPMPPR
ncbi:MAG: efflux RND transporter periplasmic adaptor subunit [Planctomycetes bacterium]|nr:efflux RND transporter periplasmic adaptor subunit [Planctomycetota bacterium]